MHVQVPTPNWTDGLLAMPDGVLLKSVSDPGILLDGYLKWVAAGRDPSRLFLDYRHDDFYLPSGTWEELKAHWRGMFFRFVDRTYLELFAPIVTLVEENNEYFDDGSIVREGLAKYLTSAQAAVSVWNGEFRGRTVNSPDGGQGQIRSDCRLVLGNVSVSNSVPRAYYQLALDTDSVVGYHNYSLWTNGVRYGGDWAEHSGLWDILESRYGLKPLYAFTEGSLYDGTPAGGWRAGTCIGGDAGLLVEALRQMFVDMTGTRAYAEDRLLGPGALFTIGGNVTGWPDYELERDQLVEIGRMLTGLWKPGGTDVDDQTRIDIAGHAQSILDLVRLYRGRTPAPRQVRDAAGLTHPDGVLPTGTVVPVYAERSEIGGWQNRVIIHPDGRNIWAEGLVQV